MIFLTVKRQKKLAEIIKNTVWSEAWHHDNVVLEEDQSNEERIRQIQLGIADELAQYFHRRPWWKFWNRPKKCKPIPCPN